MGLFCCLFAAESVVAVSDMGSTADYSFVVQIRLHTIEEPLVSALRMCLCYAKFTHQEVRMEYAVRQQLPGNMMEADREPFSSFFLFCAWTYSVNMRFRDYI